MEFNVSSAELLKGLSDVARAIPAKSPISILENFLFAVKDGNLEITASDQELTLRTNISVDVREEGSMAVPAHQGAQTHKAHDKAAGYSLCGFVAQDRRINC